jgi:predicted nucleic acid-binding protein
MAASAAPVLECANAASADFLVTGNVKHFPPDWANVRVVTPRQFLDVLAMDVTSH